MFVQIDYTFCRLITGFGGSSDFCVIDLGLIVSVPGDDMTQHIGKDLCGLVFYKQHTPIFCLASLLS